MITRRECAVLEILLKKERKKERKKENPDQSGEGKYFLPRNEKCTEKF